MVPVAEEHSRKVAFPPILEILIIMVRRFALYPAVENLVYDIHAQSVTGVKKSG
jgi:hypothetical protein